MGRAGKSGAHTKDQGLRTWDLVLQEEPHVGLPWSLTHKP